MFFSSDGFNKENRVYWLKSILRILLVVLLICAVLVPAMESIMAARESRVVLARSKAVTLAVKSTLIEFYGTNQVFADQTQPFGITAEAAEAIRSYSDCDGDFYLIQWDSKQHRVLHSLYVEGEYTVVYTVDEEGTEMWQLYHVEPK